MIFLVPPPGDWGTVSPDELARSLDGDRRGVSVVDLPTGTAVRVLRRAGAAEQDQSASPTFPDRAEGIRIMAETFSQEFCSVAPCGTGGRIVTGARLRNCLVKVADGELVLIQAPSPLVVRAPAAGVEIVTPPGLRKVGTVVIIGVSGKLLAVEFDGVYRRQQAYARQVARAGKSGFSGLGGAVWDSLAWATWPRCRGPPAWPGGSPASLPARCSPRVLPSLSPGRPASLMAGTWRPVGRPGTLQHPGQQPARRIPLVPFIALHAATSRTAPVKPCAAHVPRLLSALRPRPCSRNDSSRGAPYSGRPNFRASHVQDPGDQRHANPRAPCSRGAARQDRYRGSGGRGLPAFSCGHWSVTVAW